MKQILLFSLVALFGACTDYEDQVKDLRKHNVEVDDSYEDNDDPVDENESSSESMEDSTNEEKTNTTESTSEWSYKVTFLSEDNWGYQIFQKEKMIINQASIPSVQGIKGFDSEEKAERTAKYILNKVENGIFPPTVNKEELENLDVLRD